MSLNLYSHHPLFSTLSVTTKITRSNHKIVKMVAMVMLVVMMVMVMLMMVVMMLVLVMLVMVTTRVSIVTRSHPAAQSTLVLPIKTVQTLVFPITQLSRRQFIITTIQTLLFQFSHMYRRHNARVPVVCWRQRALDQKLVAGGSSLSLSLWRKSLNVAAAAEHLCCTNTCFFPLRLTSDDHQNMMIIKYPDKILMKIKMTSASSRTTRKTQTY